MYTPFYLVLLSRLLALLAGLAGLATSLTCRLRLTGWLRLTCRLRRALPATYQLQSTSAGHSTALL